MCHSPLPWLGNRIAGCPYPVFPLWLKRRPRIAWPPQLDERSFALQNIRPRARREQDTGSLPEFREGAKTTPNRQCPIGHHLGYGASGLADHFWFPDVRHWALIGQMPASFRIATLVNEVCLEGQAAQQ